MVVPVGMRRFRRFGGAPGVDEHDDEVAGDEIEKGWCFALDGLVETGFRATREATFTTKVTINHDDHVNKLRM